MTDAAELEREAEAARARLSDTAEQIRARMSPGQLMDEVLNQFRGGDGSQMLANLRDQARDNPMALALVGSGLAWLMLGSGQTSLSPSASSRPSYGDRSFGSYRQDSASGLGTSRYDSDRGLGYGAGNTASDWAGGSEGEAGRDWSGAAAQAVQGASDALASARTEVGEGLSEAGEQARRMAHDLRSAGHDAVGGIRHSASDVGGQARDTFLDVLEREPLVIGAIGLAVGAAIGAFLPATDIERQHLGPAGEALKEKADALVDRGMAKAKEAAAEVYETARNEADHQGLLPGEAPISEKIDAVVHAAGEAAGGIIERNAPDAGPRAGTEADPGTAGAGSASPRNPASGTDFAAGSEAGADTDSASGRPQSLRP